MPPLREVNTTDLAGAIRLGCETMQRIFNSEDDGCPHFMATARPPEQVGFGYGSTYTEAHVPGRHLLALLKARALLDVEISPQAIKNHRRAAYLSFSGAAPFPLNRDAPGAPLVNFADHNLREGLFAAASLVQHCNDSRAAELGEKCIAGVLERWNPRTGWDAPWLASRGVKLIERTFIWGPARCIGALVLFHQVTGSPRALELAEILADKATAEFFREDGRFDHVSFGEHTHSTTCTLSSLAQLALHRNDAALMQRVRTFFDHGLNQIRDELGWVMEMSGKPGWNPDRGEINNTGDILETALILARAGDSHRYGDVERMLRCHLLPAQLRDTSFIVEPASRLAPGSDPSCLPDGHRDVARRMRGAFGFPAPYGHEPIGMTLIEFCLDIVGGGVSSLCEAWREAVGEHEHGLRVNLLFDRDDDRIRVESPYTNDTLRITLKKPQPLWVRIPGAERAESPPPSLRITLPATATETARPTEWYWSESGGYVHLPHPPGGRPIEFRFDLPTSEVTLRNHPRPIRVRFRGDAVAAMDNHGAELTFFDPLA